MVIDIKTQEVMARRIDYGWGLPRPFEGDRSCFKKEERDTRWGINREGFTEYQWKFQFLGDNK